MTEKLEGGDELQRQKSQHPVDSELAFSWNSNVSENISCKECIFMIYSYNSAEISL